MIYQIENPININIGTCPCVTLHGKRCSDTIILYNEKEDYYWIEFKPFDILANVNITVSKETEEYQVIKDLLNTNDNQNIKKYAHILLIKYSDPENLYDKITLLANIKYDIGYMCAQSDIRKSLGIN